MTKNELFEMLENGTTEEKELAKYELRALGYKKVLLSGNNMCYLEDYDTND